MRERGGFVHPALRIARRRALLLKTHRVGVPECGVRGRTSASHCIHSG